MNITQSDPDIGIVQVATDLISPAPTTALSALLDQDNGPRPGDALPPLWHWLYFWSVARQSELGADGHPRTGGFLPDFGLPRRMAAGGRLSFSAPLLIGTQATRTSRILSAQRKDGRSGRLAFVRVGHAIDVHGVLAIREEQDIVYRESADPGAPLPPPQSAPVHAHWLCEIKPSETLLFRYSALTFNGHRIHYDRSYARDIEYYSDLVVHGPLIATLLADLLARNMPRAVVRDFTYKAVRPTFLGNPFTICGRLSGDGATADLWAKDHEGWLTMSAHVRFA